MPMRGELSAPTITISNRSKAKKSRSRFLSEVTRPDFLAVVYVCIIGLLITACLVQLTPNFGELSEVLQVYP